MGGLYPKLYISHCQKCLYRVKDVCIGIIMGGEVCAVIISGHGLVTTINLEKGSATYYILSPP